MKLTLTLIIGLGFLIGCGSRGQTALVVEKKPSTQIVQKIEEHAVVKRDLPPAPKKVHKAKKVEDSNYSDKYMYPDDGSAAKKDPVVTTETPVVHSNSMSKEECIAMISQEKFDKYSTMLGSEAASIKRCIMLKAMKK